MLAGGSGGGGSKRRRLSAGEVQRQLNAIGGSTRVALEPDLLWHVSWGSLIWHALRTDQSKRAFTTLAMHKGVVMQRLGDASVQLTPKPATSAMLLPVQLRSIALMYREDESKFLNWAKDVGLLRLQQYQDFLRQ